MAHTAIAELPAPAQQILHAEELRSSTEARRHITRSAQRPTASVQQEQWQPTSRTPNYPMFEILAEQTGWAALPTAAQPTGPQEQRCGQCRLQRGPQIQSCQSESSLHRAVRGNLFIDVFCLMIASYYCNTTRAHPSWLAHLPGRPSACSLACWTGQTHHIAA